MNLFSKLIVSYYLLNFLQLHIVLSVISFHDSMLTIQQYFQLLMENCERQFCDG